MGGESIEIGGYWLSRVMMGIRWWWASWRKVDNVFELRNEAELGNMV